MLNNWSGNSRLTADPELKQTQSGVSTCTVSIAVQRDYADDGGARQADFISVVAWRQTAEFICKYFRRGSMIAVVGELRTRTYNDRNHPDVKHYVTEVYADKVSFCGGRNEGGGSDNPAPLRLLRRLPCRLQSMTSGRASATASCRFNGGLKNGKTSEKRT